MIELTHSRTDTITVRFWTDEAKTIPEDISADTFAADLRAEVESDSTLFLTFAVDMTDAANGVIVLTAAGSAWADVPTSARIGFTDVKRTTAGEPRAAFDGPLSVQIKPTPTA